MSVCVCVCVCVCVGLWLVEGWPVEGHNLVVSVRWGKQRPLGFRACCLRTASYTTGVPLRSPKYRGLPTVPWGTPSLLTERLRLAQIPDCHPGSVAIIIPCMFPVMTNPGKEVESSSVTQRTLYCSVVTKSFSLLCVYVRTEVNAGDHRMSQRWKLQTAPVTCWIRALMRRVGDTWQKNTSFVGQCVKINILCPTLPAETHTHTHTCTHTQTHSCTCTQTHTHSQIHTYINMDK